MRNYRIIALIILITLTFIPANGISRSDKRIIEALSNNLKFIRCHLSSPGEAKNTVKFKKKMISAPGSMAVGLIKTYQIFLSSQTQGVCIFVPSCSRFTQDAIIQNGIIKGSLLGADRILRCHPYSIMSYPLEPGTNKAIDPVNKYLTPN